MTDQSFIKTHLKIIATVLVLAVMLAITGEVSASSESMHVPAVGSSPDDLDTLSVLRQFHEALRAGQINSALNFLAEDVRLTESSGETVTGKVSVRDVLNRLQFEQTELSDLWIAGDEIAWQVRISAGAICTSRSGWAIVRQGKIVMLSFAD